MGRRMASASISTVRKIIKIIEGGCPGDECTKCEFKKNTECMDLKKYCEIKNTIKKNYGVISKNV